MPSDAQYRKNVWLFLIALYCLLNIFLRPPKEGLRSILFFQKQPKDHGNNCKKTPVFQPLKMTFSPKRKNTIPIYISAEDPRLGTIGKNHIQSSSNLSRTALFVVCSESDTFLKNYITKFRL